MADVDIVVRGVQQGKGNTATISVASETTTALNDYVLVVASVDYKAAVTDLSIANATGVVNLTGAAGWTQVTTSNSGVVMLSKAWIGKVTTAGARTAVVSQNASGSGLHVHVYTLNPSAGAITVDGTPSTLSDVTTPYPHTQITVTGTKSMLVCYHGQVVFGITLAYGAAPAGMTQGAANYHNAASGLQSCYQMLTATGATGGRSQTSNTGTADAGVGSMFALRSQTSTTAHTGAASFTGAGALTADARRVQPVGASFTGAGAMVAPAGIPRSGAAAFSGTGALTATAARDQGVSASFTGAGSLSAIPGASADAAFAGSGALTAGAGQGHAVSASFTGAGSLATPTRVTHKDAAAFTGAGALTVDGRRVHPTGATFTGAGALTADGRRVHPGVVSFTGAGSMLGTGVRFAAAGAMFTGAGKLTASASSTAGGVLNVSLWAIDRDHGDRLVPLPHFVKLALSLQENSPGSISVEYPAWGAGFDVLDAGVTKARDLEVEVWLGGRRSTALVGYLQQKAGDDVAEGATFSFTGSFLERRLAEALVYPQSSDPKKELRVSAQTPGQIALLLLGQAQARGALTDIAHDFSATHDSAGVAWPDTVTAKWTPSKTTVLQVLTTLVDLGLCEFEITAAKVLRLYGFGGRGRDRTVAPGIVTFRRGRNVTEATRRESSRDGGTAALIDGAEGLYATAENATALAARGRRVEVSGSAGNIEDQGTLNAYAQRTAQEAGTGQDERTFGLAFGAGHPRPGVSFGIGDLVRTDTRGQLEHQRVAQWMLTVDPKGIDGSAVVGDLIADRLLAMRRRLESSLSGGLVVGTSTPSPNTDDGLAPAAPAGLVASSLAYYDGTTPQAQATIGWTAVTQNTDGSPIDDLSGYEVQLNYADLDTAWFTAGITHDTSLTYSPLMQGAAVQVRVRAYDQYDRESAWSSEIAFTTAADADAPSTPSTPAASNYIGLLRIDWDGLGSVGEAMSADFSYVEIHISTASAFTPDRPADMSLSTTYVDRLFGAGSFPVAVGTYGVTHYVRLVAVDKTGNASAASGSASATPGQVADGDIAAVSIGKLTTGIMSALLTISGIIRTATSGSRVELDTTGLRCINAAGITVFEYNIPAAVLNMIGRFATGTTSGGARVVIDPAPGLPTGNFPSALFFSANGTRGPGRINATDQVGGVTALGLNSGPSTATSTFEQSTLFMFPDRAVLSVNNGDGLSARGARVWLDKNSATMEYAPNNVIRTDVNADNNTVSLGTPTGTLTVGNNRVNSNLLFTGNSDSFAFAAQNGGTFGYRMASDGALLRFIDITSGDWLNDPNGSGGIKTFVIPHPVDPDRYLVHATTESPTAGVEYWGEAEIVGGTAVVELPAYFEALTQAEGRQVQVSMILSDEDMSTPAVPPIPVGIGPVRDGAPWPPSGTPGMPATPEHVHIPRVAASTPRDGRFRISCSGPDGTRVAWLVKATRKDVAQFEVEPLCSETDVRGGGPYRYIVP